MGFIFDTDSITPDSGSGGGSAVIETLQVIPSTSAQTITAPSGVDGYSPINVSAVTSDIDENIIASNIISGVSILGVNGSATVLNGETVSITPTTSQQIITPTTPKNGITQATVAAVTSDIDANIVAGNIKDGVTILNVTGTYTGGGSGSTEIPSYEVTSGVAGRKTLALTGNEFSTITSIANNGLNMLFYKCSGITGQMNLSNVTSIGKYGLSNAFVETRITSINLSSLTTVDEYGFNYAFNGCTSLILINLSSVTNVQKNSFSRAFSGCTGLLTANLSGVVTVQTEAFDYTFDGCSNLTSVDLSNLVTVGTSTLKYTFQNCSSLQNVYLSKLKNIGISCFNNTFRNCTSLTSISFPLVDNITTSAFSSPFYGCTNLTDVYFNALKTTSFSSYTNQFSSLLSSTGSSTTHTLHFPSNLSTKISSLTGYPNFGGTSGYVTLSFDLAETS